MIKLKNNAMSILEDIDVYLDFETAYKRLQVIVKDFQNKAERLAYAVGDKTDIKLVDPETNKPLKPFRHKSDKDMAKAYRKVLLEAVDSLQDIMANAQSTEQLKTDVDVVCESLEKQLGILEQIYYPLPATKARLFQSEVIETIPTGYPIRTSTICQIRHDLWQQDSNGIAFYRQESKRNPKNYVEHYITSAGDVTLLPWEDAKQIIDQLGFDTAKLQFIFASHTMDEAEPWKSSFTLKGKDVINELGWNKRTDKTLTEKLRDIANNAFALNSLLVKARWEEGRTKNGKIIVSTEVSRMWNVTIRTIGVTQGVLFGSDEEELTEVLLTVQPGGWTQGFLNKPGWNSKEALYQFGYLAQDVLRIDPYHDELALRLALHLTTDCRCHESGTYRVRTLLEVAMPIPEIEAARSDRRRGYDLKQRWDNALKLLIGLGWEVRFDEETYPEWLRPGSSERNKRGYFDKLLDAKITIKPIPAIQARLARLKEPSKPKSLKPACVGLTGSEIRKAREAKGWTQTKLAGTLGISKQLASHIESGRRTALPELATHIKRVLDIQD